MAPAILAAIQGVMALVAAMPQIEAVGASAKAYFTALFEGKLISKEVQDALNAQVDSILALFKLGVTLPPEFQVQPDPQ